MTFSTVDKKGSCRSACILYLKYIWKKYFVFSEPIQKYFKYIFSKVFCILYLNRAKKYLLQPWACAEVYFRTKWRLRPSSRLATIDMNREQRAVSFLGGAGSPSVVKVRRSGPERRSACSLMTAVLRASAVSSSNEWCYLNVCSR